MEYIIYCVLILVGSEPLQNTFDSTPTTSLYVISEFSRCSNKSGNLVVPEERDRVWFGIVEHSVGKQVADRAQTGQVQLSRDTGVILDQHERHARNTRSHQ